MDPLRLNRLQKKLVRLIELDTDRLIFGSQEHQYILNPKKTAEELSAFETEYEITLPAEYKAYLCQVANGGAGPFYGLYSLEQGLGEAVRCSTQDGDSIQDPFARDFSLDEKTIREFIDHQATLIADGDDDEVVYPAVPYPFTGVIFLSSYGCGWSYVLVVRGEQAGKIWLVGDYLSPCLKEGEQWGFFDWYEDWLDRSMNELVPQSSLSVAQKPQTIANYDGLRLTEFPQQIIGWPLKKLVLSRNDFLMFPLEILSFKELRTLDLSMTPITKLPEEMKELQHLKKLRFNYTNARELPACLTELPELEELSMYYSYQIETLPDMIGRLSHLKHLNVSFSNNLKSLPENVGDLQQLVSLYLNDCGSLTALPEGISQLKNVVRLYLGNTNIKRLPDHFEKLENLESLGLDIADLDLEDALQKIKKLPKLRYLKLTNQLTYPDTLAELTHLTYLVVTQNYTLWRAGHKTLPIPEQVTLIPHLETLEMTNNNQANHLPESLGRSRELQVLYLGSTAIQEFPKSIQELKNIKKIQGGLQKDPTSLFGFRQAEKDKVIKLFPKAKIWIY